MKNKKYTPTDIAFKFIDLGISNSNPLNRVKLNKLLYITHGLYLASQHKSLFNEQPIAKPFGPYFKSLEKEFNILGNDNMDYFTLISRDVNIKFSIYPSQIEDFLLDIYYNTCNLNISQLLNFTNAINGAWHNLFINNKFDRPITDEAIMIEFKQYII